MPENPAPQPSVCALLVTYHPDEGLPARLARILPQVRLTVVVDNGSGGEAAGMLTGLAALPDVALIANGENLGIARALNLGIRHALAEGAAWVLLVDQDTEVDDDIVAKLMAVAESHPDRSRLAVVGSRFRDTRGRRADSMRLEARGDSWQAVESVITSGSLLALDVYLAIGPFRDEFFIDYVDTEYCYRARAAGYHVIETVEPLMSHTIGAPTQHRVLGRTKWTTNHSADRRYYMARNNTVLLREYGTSRSRGWRYRSVARCFRLCKRIAWFERDKVAKIVAVIDGWWDGVRGNMGPRRPR
jgi:rhamnosyltransferase